MTLLIGFFIHNFLPDKMFHLQFIQSKRANEVAAIKNGAKKTVCVLTEKGNLNGSSGRKGDAREFLCSETLISQVL